MTFSDEGDKELRTINPKMRILSCMNASNPDIPGKVFEDPRSGSLIQRRVILMLTGVNFEWVKHGTEEDGEDNIFSELTPSQLKERLTASAKSRSALTPSGYLT